MENSHISKVKKLQSKIDSSYKEINLSKAKVNEVLTEMIVKEEQIEKL